MSARKPNSQAQLFGLVESSSLSSASWVLSNPSIGHHKFYPVVRLKAGPLKMRPMSLESSLEPKTGLHMRT